jgi:UDP-N-acetylglucosamine 2-epimerase (non-hydrolysing)
MLKVLTVIGTRPEAIKMAPVIQALEARERGVESRVCVTAQHREMLDQVLARFRLRADHDLDLMTRAQTPSAVGAAVLRDLPRILAVERPDWVLVQGDTTTTAAAAMAAAYAGIAVAHVEAGLRSHDLAQPFPEELNRRLVAQAARLHLAPTPHAREHLLAEGVAPEAIRVTGNTGIDALYLTIAELDPEAEAAPFADLPPDARIVLATAHRRENLGRPLARICAALREIAAGGAGKTGAGGTGAAGRTGPTAPGYTAADDPDRGDIHVVYPLHPRPEVSEVGRRLLGDAGRVVLCEPLDHPALVRLMLRSELVITDSGGLQEEAPTLGKPVVVLREVTERPEAVEAGAARLVGTDPGRIVAAARDYLGAGRGRPWGERPAQHYGDGRAAERIVAALLGEPVEEWEPRLPAASGQGTRARGSR